MSLSKNVQHNREDNWIFCLRLSKFNRVSGNDVIYGTDVRVADVARELGTSCNWTSLAHCLGVPDDEIVQIDNEYPVERRLVTVFRIWLERNGSSANAHRLGEALARLELRDVADRFFRQRTPVDYVRLGSTATPTFKG